MLVMFVFVIMFVGCMMVLKYECFVLLIVMVYFYVMLIVFGMLDVVDIGWCDFFYDLFL